MRQQGYMHGRTNKGASAVASATARHDEPTTRANAPVEESNLDDALDRRVLDQGTVLAPTGASHNPHKHANVTTRHPFLVSGNYLIFPEQKTLCVAVGTVYAQSHSCT